MKFMKKIALGMITLLLFSFTPQIAFSQGLKQQSVTTTGTGKTEKDAIKDALVLAVSQVKGLSISSKEMVSIKDKIQNENVSSSTDYQNKINTYTQGIVSQFEVLESEKSKLTGTFKVKVKAVIPTYNAGAQINRLRLAVVPIRISSNINDRSSAEKYAQTWASNLEEGLVQSRRFAMLDRSFTDITNKETQQYTNGNFSIAELARLGQQAGTDYLVTGELRKYLIVDKSVINPLTGGKIARSNTNIELSLRLIDVATGQIKFAKTYGDSKLALQDIINAIYPLAIVSVSKNEVVIGHGGDDLKPGQRYRVMALGQNLRDPYTGESLGRQEIAVGEIEISDVQSKTSQAVIIDGNQQINERFSTGLILRPIIKSASPQKPAPRKPKRLDDEW
jgi:curli biogenesis system outer membrane secretion channel CsgG